MGSFGQSKSSQQQQSTQQSSALSEQQANAWGQSTGQSSQGVWGGQTGALGDLYSAAQGLLRGGPAAAPAGVQQAFGQALAPGVNPYFSASLNSAIDAASRGFSENVLPQLRSSAVGVGAYGGNRAQLAEGQAAGDFGQSLTQMVSQLAGNQYATDVQGRNQALSLFPSFQQSQYLPLQLAAQMIGGPTVLGQSSNLAQNLSQSSGFSQATSSGQSTGSGRSNSMQMGISGK